MLKPGTRGMSAIGRRQTSATGRTNFRYRRPHRYGAHLDRLPVVMPEIPPGCSGEIDPDQAIGDLDWQLGDLVDEAELPLGANPELAREP
jgi:hypothetical protein